MLVSKLISKPIAQNSECASLLRKNNVPTFQKPRLASLGFFMAVDFFALYFGASIRFAALCVAFAAFVAGL